MYKSGEFARSTAGRRALVQQSRRRRHLLVSFFSPLRKPADRAIYFLPSVSFFLIEQS